MKRELVLFLALVISLSFISAESSTFTQFSTNAGVTEKSNSSMIIAVATFVVIVSAIILLKIKKTSKKKRK